MNSIVNIISINTDNTKKFLNHIGEKIYINLLLLKSGSISINREKFIKTMNEIIIFLIMVIGVERTVKLFWTIMKIIVGCGYTIRYLIMKKNIKNIENIENIENKVDENINNTEYILTKLNKINVEIENIGASIKNISNKLDINSTSIDVLKKNVNFGIMGTDYYAPF